MSDPLHGLCLKPGMQIEYINLCSDILLRCSAKSPKTLSAVIKQNLDQLVCPQIAALSLEDACVIGFYFSGDKQSHLAADFCKFAHSATCPSIS